MTTLYVGAPTLYLAGSGVIVGATSVTLSTFSDIYGNVLTMADFGALGYGNCEPDTTNSEFFTFTGVTANTNGTYTLTGVKTVLAKSPYTQTSGLVRSHAGGTKVVITDNVGFWDTFLNKNNDSSVLAKYTFPDDDTNRARITTDTDTAVATAFVTLGQLSRQAISGASNASTTVKGIIQLPTQAQAEAGTSAGSTGALLALANTNYGARYFAGYAADAGSTDAYAITLAPVPSAYFTGMLVMFMANTQNTGAATLNVNGLGAKNLFFGGVALITGLLNVGSTALCQYDGTQFNILSVSNGSAVAATAGKIAQRNSTGDVTVNTTPTASTDATSKSYVDGKTIKKTGNTTHDMTSTTTTTIAHGLGVVPTFVTFHVNSVIANASLTGGSVGQVVSSIGMYDGTTQNSNYVAASTNGGTVSSGQDTTHAIHYGYGATAGADSDKLIGTVTFDATNITITWAKTNSSTGTGNIIWTAEA